MLNHRCVKCGKLMFKSSHLQGHVQVMCPRCKKLNEIRKDVMLSQLPTDEAVDL